MKMKDYSSFKKHVMKNSGISLTEFLAAMAIFTIIFYGTFVSLRVGTDSWQLDTNRTMLTINTRNALTRIMNDLESSNAQSVNLKKCSSPSDCFGEEVLFQVPIADKTKIAYSIYKPDGAIKVGAEGKQNCVYSYKVNSSHNLVKSVRCLSNNQYCGDGICNGSDNTTNCIYDCGVCGDNMCSAELLENPTSCPNDCAACNNDSICGVKENCMTCSTDCGICPDNMGS